MAKRNKQWEVKQWRPNAQLKRERVNKLREKYNKVTKVENNNELLFSVGSSLIKQRRRENRPKIYDELSLRSKWKENPRLSFIANIEFNKLKQFYESEEYLDVKKKWKKFDKELELPDESKLYKRIVERQKSLVSLSSQEKSLYGQVIKSELEEDMRIFFSRKISKPEIMQRWETVSKENKLILSLKKTGRFNNKSDKEYLTAAYDFLRESISKNKDMFSSDTIFTAVMSSGIDEFIDEDLETNETLMNKFRESLDANFGEIQQLRQSILGDEVKLNDKPSFITVDRERFKMLKNYDTVWGDIDDLTDDEFKRLTGITKISIREKARLSDLFPKIGELRTAKDLISKASKGLKGDRFSYDNFVLAKQILENKKFTNDDIRMVELRNLIKNKVSDEFIEAVILK